MKKKRFQVLAILHRQYTNFLSWKKEKRNWKVLLSLLFFFFFWQDKTKFNWVSPGKPWCYYGHCILLSWIASDSKLGWTEIFQKWKGSACSARALRSLCGLNQSLALHCRGWRQEKKVPTWIFRDPGNRFCVNARSKDQCEIFRVSLHEGSTETVMWLGPCHVHSK